MTDITLDIVHIFGYSIVENKKIDKGMHSMRVYKFADIPVGIKTRGKYFGKKCSDYLAGDETPMFEMYASDEDLEYERTHSEDDEEHFKSYLEYVALYRKFCEKVLDYQVVLCHGSVVEVDDKAYLFTAPSGTGKSTHTRMWRQIFGDRAVMINDDKPLLRFKEDGVYVYGTPWDGKHHLSTNKCSKLAGICFLSQAKENSICKIDKEEALPMLINQIYRSRSSENLIKTLDYVDILIDKIPMYKMGCTISEEAAKMSYEVMSKETGYEN